MITTKKNRLGHGGLKKWIKSKTEGILNILHVDLYSRTQCRRFFSSNRFLYLRPGFWISFAFRRIFVRVCNLCSSDRNMNNNNHNLSSFFTKAKETLNYRHECTSHTLLHTKILKLVTLFDAKTTRQPYSLRLHIAL